MLHASVEIGILSTGGLQMAKTLSFLNFKGGVGKTSTTALVSYNMAKLGHKVLVIDLDPQANITSLFLKTLNANGGQVVTITKSLMSAINEDLKLTDIAININDNLDLIPNAVDFSFYNRYLDNNLDTEKQRVEFLKSKIEEFKNDYDYIFLDVPPTISLPNDTAFYACDQIIVVLQTQERSLSGAEVLLEYLQNTIINEFHSTMDVMGILPVLTKRNAAVDSEILKAATAEFGEENIFENKITTMERIKRMDMTGISDNTSDAWDKKVHEAFSKVANEIIERLNN